LWVGVLALFAASLFAPPLASAQIKLGVKGGLNIADIGGSDAGTTETKTGFVAGGFAEFMIGNMFAIQPEVLYSQKGTKESISGGELKFKLDYIEVPVLLKINIPIEGSKVHPNVYVGPSVGFKSSCKVSGSSGGVSADVDCDAGGTDPIKSTDFGLAFGGGVSFDVGGAEIGVDVRYTLGLSTIDDEADPDDLKNQVISIMGTVGFPLNR
jgi:opacity protein-like surface antigen